MNNVPDITTKGIIKALPFDNEFKTNLLSTIDSLPSGQKLVIEQLLWQAYYVIYKLKIQENLQLALQKVKGNQENLDKDLYKRVVEQTEKEMDEEFLKGMEQTDLTAVREKIQSIIQQNPAV